MTTPAPSAAAKIPVKIVECPRDAWQALPKNMPAEIKADYLRTLIAAGFTHIDAVSFVSRTAVPQMADAELVLEYLDPPDDVEIIGIVVNKKGAERAVKTGSVHTIGFPYSVSETFLQRNQSQSAQEAVDALEAVGNVAQMAGLDTVGYLSMAWGNPYADPWSADEVVTACELLVESGVKAISLADTVGLATPAQVGDLVAAVLAANLGVELGVHLHATPQTAAAKVRAAFAAGCRRFDSALAGLGGCPFAQDALVGNLATETLLAELTRLGADPGPLRSFAGPVQDSLLHASAEIAMKYGARVQ